MLKLKQVSKFYYSKGMISSGFSKVNLNFDLGEFVAITGESGSGKSTLLNVISGLDSYEEGEMYINGKETSHYTEKDYENYRKKYIGNIFQSFNLVNSYTVYQNIELVMLLNGKRKRDVKQQIIDIIKQVDLYKYRNRKVSKLSGGQKQRVAIARALAQNTPIILADEPTGNLDSKSAQSVLKILHEISKDKLVIVVTHNYDQIEEYVTRKITMHDGKVLEDKKIKDTEEVNNVHEAEFKDIRWYNKLRLGIRNAFNIIPKFLLIFAVYAFITFALFFVYSSFKQAEYLSSTDGYNNFFHNLSDKRIVIKKNDKTSFSEEEYMKIKKLSNVDKIIKDDLSLDNSTGISSTDDSYFFYGNFDTIENFNGKIAYGRMPESDNEIIIEGSKDDFSLSSYYKEILETEFRIEELYNPITNKSYNAKIVGIVFRESESVIGYYDSKFYVSTEILKNLSDKINKSFSEVKYTFNGNEYNSYFDSISGEILPTGKIGRGEAIIPDDWSMQCKKMNCKKYKIDVSVNNLYFKDNKTFTITKTYTKKNFNKLTGYKYDDYKGGVFVNDEDYYALFDKGYFQSTVMIKDEKLARETIKELEKMDYKALYIPDVITTYDDSIVKIIKIEKVIILAIVIVVLFFISYFIIKLVLKSRNIYFATLRILGSSKKGTKSLLNIELQTVAHLAYLVFISFIVLLSKGIINVGYIMKLCTYVNISEYIILYVVLFLMTCLITSRYSRKLFKNTVMNTYREEA